MSRFMDLSGHGFILPFKQASISTCKAWRRKHGKRGECPLLSHALSDHDGHAWMIRDIGGVDIATVYASGKAMLIETDKGAGV